MSEEEQTFARFVDPTIDDFKISLEEANKQIDILGDKIQDLKTQLQQKENIIAKYKLIIKALYQHYHEHEYYELYEFLKQLESCTENDMNWLRKMAGENDE